MKWTVNICSELLDVQMDVTEPMDILEDDSFNLILDKGTLDSIACSEEYSVKAAQMVRNMNRILGPGGAYVCISYGRPDMRLQYLQEGGLRWKVEVHKIGKEAGGEVQLDGEQFYYAYVCKKEG